jgi:regulatory protein
MKITAISAQVRDKNRVNISVDGKYRFSLDIYQLVDLGIKVGEEFEESKLSAFEQESQFGKLYSRTLEYCLMRPHSAKEVRDYLYKKTRSIKVGSGEVKPGVSTYITKRVFDRLVEKGYIDDEKFARFWVENRCVKKGISFKKLKSELVSKGISPSIISKILDETDRDDKSELQKIIIKKRSYYNDDKKLLSYLARLGFDYEDIKNAMSVDDDF